MLVEPTQLRCPSIGSPETTLLSLGWSANAGCRHDRSRDLAQNPISTGWRVSIEGVSASGLAVGAFSEDGLQRASRRERGT